MPCEFAVNKKKLLLHRKQFTAKKKKMLLHRKQFTVFSFVNNLTARICWKILTRMGLVFLLSI